MANLYVSYQNYQTDFLAASAPESKAIPRTQEQKDAGAAEQFYSVLAFLYKYGSAEQGVLEDFYLEGPEMVSTMGITSSVAQTGNKMNYSIPSTFDLNNPEHVRFIQVLEKIYMDTALLFYKHRLFFNKEFFEAEAPFKSGYKSIVYRPKDKTTKQIIEGRAPRLYMKLYKREYKGTEYKTKFYGLDKKEISWENLTAVRMTFIPCFHVKQIFCSGGNPSLQVTLDSAVVKSAVPCGSVIKQGETIDRENAANPGLADALSAQISALVADRFGGNRPEVITKTGKNATFVGIEPVGRAPNPGDLPPIPAVMNVSQGSNESLEDFTSGAPTRSPQSGSFNLS